MSHPTAGVLTPDTPHVQASSANTATPAPLVCPKGPAKGQEATSVYLSARTNNAYVTLDGTVPTAANGIEVPVGQIVRLPVPNANVDINFCSANAAAASILNALFVKD